MSEGVVYSSVLGILALTLFGWVVPSAVIKHLKLIKAFRNGEELVEPPEKGVSSRFVNVVDVIVLLLVFGLVYSAMPPSEVTEPVEGSGEITMGSLYSTLTMQTIFVMFVVIIMMWRVKPAKQLGISLKGKWNGLWWVPVTVFTSWGATALLMVVGYFDFLAQLLGESPLQKAVLVLRESENIPLVVLMSLVACVGAPVSEEVLFRGYVFPVIKGFIGKWGAIILSAALFSIFHYNLASLPTLFLMGGLLAYIYDRTKTIWVPIMAHMVFNSATVLAQIVSRYNPELMLEF